MGGYERDRRAVDRRRDDVRRHPGDFNGRLLPENWDRFEEITANPQVRVPAMADVGLRKVINGPEAFTPDNEFMPRRDRGGRVLRRGRVLRARHRRRRRHRQGDGRLDRRRRPRHGRVAHGRAAGSARSTARRPTRSRAPSRPTQTYYDIVYPGHEREAGRPLRTAPAYPWHVAHGAPSARSPAGSGSTTTSATPRLGDDSLRPRGWAGRLWSPASAVEHAATREAAALFDESSFAKLEVTGPDAAALLEWVCDNHVARGGRRHHLHAGAQRARRHRVGLHRHPRRRRRVPGRHRHGVRVARHGLAATPGTATCGRRTHRRRDRSVRHATRCGVRAAATSCGR